MIKVLSECFLVFIVVEILVGCAETRVPLNSEPLQASPPSEERLYSFIPKVRLPGINGLDMPEIPLSLRSKNGRPIDLSANGAENLAYVIDDNGRKWEAFFESRLEEHGVFYQLQNDQWKGLPLSRVSFAILKDGKTYAGHVYVLVLPKGLVLNKDASYLSEMMGIGALENESVTVSRFYYGEVLLDAQLKPQSIKWGDSLYEPSNEGKFIAVQGNFEKNDAPSESKPTEHISFSNRNISDSSKKLLKILGISLKNGS